MIALLHGPVAPVRPPAIRRLLEDAAADFSRIRCPLCRWQPAPSDRWCCGGEEPPEMFAGCGTVWNTFETHGRCPGCDHQWRSTSCLACHRWSPHEEWYVTDAEPPGRLG
jgi:hypothetical protein